MMCHPPGLSPPAAGPPPRHSVALERLFRCTDAGVRSGLVLGSLGAVYWTVHALSAVYRGERRFVADGFNGGLAVGAIYAGRLSLLQLEACMPRATVAAAAAAAALTGAAPAEHNRPPTRSPCPPLSPPAARAASKAPTWPPPASLQLPGRVAVIIGVGTLQGVLESWYHRQKAAEAAAAAAGALPCLRLHLSSPCRCCVALVPALHWCWVTALC